MDKPIDHYWDLRLADLKIALESNNFEVHLAKSKEDAYRIVIETIMPKLALKTIAWGGSMTFRATGLYDELKNNPELKVWDTFEPKIAEDEKLERRRQALHADLFITGTNAVTETGQLVNLDMIGNRVGALTFGPKWVVILVGRNKLVIDLDEAMHRIKNYVAPVNAMRLDQKTPCVKTGYCEECKSPDRICNAWSIIEKSFPKDRIKVVLIDEDLGI
jgi:L-lactate utilization protein LutB